MITMIEFTARPTGRKVMVTLGSIVSLYDREHGTTIRTATTDVDVAEPYSEVVSILRCAGEGKPSVCPYVACTRPAHRSEIMHRDRDGRDFW